MSENNPTKISPLSHSFNVHVAAIAGLNAAAVYNHLLYWLSYNKRKGTNQHEGRTWTYDSMQTISAHMPYLSVQAIQRALASLIEHKLIVKGNFNKSPFDKTAWYALYDETELNLPPQRCAIDDSKSNHRECESESSSYTHIDHKEEPSTDAPPSAAPKRKSSSQKVAQTVVLVERVPLVNLSDEQHASLLQKHGAATLQSAYLALSDWKQSKAASDPHAVNKHTDYYRLIKWVIPDLVKGNSPGGYGGSRYNPRGKLAISADQRAAGERLPVGTLADLEKLRNRGKEPTA